MQMPEFDGLDVARAFHERAAARGVSVPMLVLLSSINRDETIREEAAQAGIAATLYKPIKPEQLHTRLEDLVGINGRGVEEELEAALRAEARAEARPAPMHVLVAEDNVVNQKVALRMLERLGIRGDVAANGQEALDALRRQPYDLVLMDVQMPELDGLEATRRLRAWPDTAFAAGVAPYVVALTANAMRGDRERCLEAGADDYLSKPVSVQDLSDALVAAEAGRGERDTTAAVTHARSSIADFLGEDDDAFALELARSFLADAARLVEQARAGLEADDVQAVRDAAHSVKSSSALFGFTELTTAGEALETLARQGSLRGGEERLDALARAFEDVRPVVQAIVGSAPSEDLPSKDAHSEVEPDGADEVADDEAADEGTAAAWESLSEIGVL
jgi:CheY-like chemotaxis protein